MLIVLATPIAPYTLSSSVSSNVSISTFSKLVSPTCANPSLARRRYVSHLPYPRVSQQRASSEAWDTHQSPRQLRCNRKELILELFDHGFHRAIEKIKIRLIGEFEETCDGINALFNDPVRQDHEKGRTANDFANLG